MQELLDITPLLDWLSTTHQWLFEHVADPWNLLQLLLLAMLYPLGRFCARRLSPLLETRISSLSVRPGLAALFRALPSLLAPAIFLILLWFAIGIMQEITWPSRSYLLRIVASLMTAWIVIRLGSTFIRNPVVAKTLTLGVWTLAALNITGLLGPAIEVTDALAFNVGDLRISLLTVVKGVASLALLLWGASALSRILELRINRLPDLTPSVQVLLGKLLKITLLTLAVVIALNSVGIDLTALAVFSGAIGVGIGFGLQKVVSNLISGVILLLDKSIKPGDVIELEDTFGWITSLGARYVSVVTRDGKEYLIPNEDLITHRVVNWSFSDDLVRLEIPFGVDYSCDPHEVRRVAREAAAKSPRVSDETAPVCHLVGFGDSSLDFVLRFWIKDPAAGVVNIKGEVLLDVWDAFKENGIEIPYPHRKMILQEPIVVKTVPEASTS